jgi:hypothetical protein
VRIKLTAAARWFSAIRAWKSVVTRSGRFWWLLHSTKRLMAIQLAGSELKKLEKV